MRHLDKESIPEINLIFDIDLQQYLQNFEDSVVYLDNHLLVVKKPAGLLTQPNGDNHSLEKIAKDFIKKKFAKSGNVFLHAIHRLDKQVSGLVLFARTSKALSRLNQQMRERKIVKKYYALVEGVFKKKQGLLSHFLAHLNHRAAVFENNSAPELKKAELTYSVKKESKGNSLLEIDLLTGRYHQIRAQLAFVGHPIVGDEKYGGKPVSENKNIFLCCFYLQFLHPVSKEKLTVEISF